MAQNAIVRLFGGSRHWCKDTTPDGTYPDWITYAKPRDFMPTFRHHIHDEFICEPTFDREEYVKKRAESCSFTAHHNRIYKDLVFYVRRGYKLRGMDFAIIMMDLNHDTDWWFEEAEGPWWWDLTGMQAQAAITERSMVHKGFMELKPAMAAHGPAFSKEFEKSFDNMIS